MADVPSCLKCGRGPASAGGICIACATTANLPQKFDDMLKSFGVMARVWQGSDKTVDGVDIKDNYSLNPITRSAENKKVLGRPSSGSSIDSIIRSDSNTNSKSNKSSINYMINPTIKGYSTNVSSLPSNKYVFSLTGYSIRKAKGGFDKNTSSSYGISSKQGYSSANTNSTYTGASSLNYAGASSTGSSYSGKSSSGTASGSSK